MDSHYNVQVVNDDISFTNNKNKKGSYHISIPNLNASTEKLKEIFTNFKNMCFDKDSKCINTSIYSEHWFRYPNQSKEGDETQRHKFVKGEGDKVSLSVSDLARLNVWQKAIPGKPDKKLRWVFKNHDFIHDLIMSKYTNLNTQKSHLSTLAKMYKV